MFEPTFIIVPWYIVALLAVWVVLSIINLTLALVLWFVKRKFQRNVIQMIRGDETLARQVADAAIKAAAKGGQHG